MSLNICGSICTVNLCNLSVSDYHVCTLHTHLFSWVFFCSSQLFVGQMICVFVFLDNLSIFLKALWIEAQLCWT